MGAGEDHGPALLQQGKALYGIGLVQLDVGPGQKPQGNLLPGNDTVDRFVSDVVKGTGTAAAVNPVDILMY